MHKLIVLSVAALLLAACGQPKPEETAELAAVTKEAETDFAEARSLDLVWMASGFEQPEGAALAPDGSYFISKTKTF